jgi:hypothetical protein
MWLKCSVCMNVVASGYDSKCRWRDEGSVCRPQSDVDVMMMRLGRQSESCDGILQRYTPPHPVMMYCPQCCTNYSANRSTCPTCIGLNNFMPQ